MPPIHRPLLVPTVALLAAALVPAQGQRAVPAIALQLDGNEQLPTAFQSTAFRLQQIVDGRALAPTQALVSGVAFRAEVSSLPSGGAFVPNLTLSAAETAVSPFAMGEGFAQNASAPPTIVYQASLSLPPQAPPAAGPVPFAIPLPFAQPVTVRTGAGFHLLLDLVAVDANPSPTAVVLDAAVTGGAVERVGRSGTLGTGDNLNFVAYGGNGPASLAPGGLYEVATTTSFSSYPGATLVGLLPLPQAIDLGPLGAPGNTLYVDGIAAVPHAWQRTFIGWAAPVSFALPQDPAIAGASIWAQAVLVEAGSNALGAVTTEAAHAVLGDVSFDPLQAVVAADPAAGVGSWAFGAQTLGGAVVEVQGSFR